MKITFPFLNALAGLSLCLLASCTGNGPAVNAVLGDASYIKKFGQAPGNGTPEDVRIRTHLEYVEDFLRGTATDHLDPQQREKRNRLLDLLHDYRIAGIFPVNAKYTERTPCFIDDEGRICAVGYLVEKTAGRAVAESINSDHCYEKILDMKNAVLDEWIAGSGLSLLECAMIQPAYGWYPTPAPVYTNNNHISTEYGIASAITGGVNISLNAIHVVQLSKGTADPLLPVVGMVLGAFQVALGLDNMPTEQSDAFGNNTTNESQKTLSFVNIGIGTSTLVLSTWNLIDKKDPRRRTAWNLYGYPGSAPGIGFSLAHRF